MRVLVTGGTGFIGRHLVALLAADGCEVVTLSLSTECPDGSRGHVSCQIDSPEAREFACTADAILHLASLSDASLSSQEPFEYNRINAVGTLNLLEAARRNGALFLLASSQRVYAPGQQAVSEEDPPNPREPYAYSKLVAETWTRMYSQSLGVPAAIVRFFSVYGPGQRAGKGASGVVGIFVQRALQNRDLTVMGESVRDFTFVTDAAFGLQLALAWLQKGNRWGVFNVATGLGTSLRDLALAVKDATGSCSAVRVEQGPEESYVAELTNARDHLGYRPRVSLQEGLRLYADWYRQHLAEG